MDSDDATIGYILTRREMLALMGSVVVVACGPSGSGSPSPAASASSGTGAASLTPSASAASPSASASTATAVPSASASASAALPSCIVRPALTEGPYYVDENLDRSDIRPDPATGVVSQGVSLALAFAVSRIDADACVPFEGALVDVWHCDAFGVYSDVQGNDEKFLRGFQTTDATGMATFTTIYPGWYRGRAVHIHFKIRSDASASAQEFTSQLFFDDSLSDQVYQVEPYAQKGQRDRLNSRDGIFGQSDGLLTLSPTGDASSGLTALFDIGLQLS